MNAPPATARAILAIAFPSAVFTVLTQGYRVVDQYYGQRISVEAQAAIGSSTFVLIFFFAAFELISAGAGPLIARATGARDDALRRRVLGESITGAMLLTVVLMAIGAGGAGLIARSLGLSGQTAIECTTYLRWLFLTMLPLVLTPLIDQAFLSMGNARAPLWLHALSLAINVLLTPLLIDAMGIGGAALASNIARGVATLLGLMLLVRETGLTIKELRLAGQLGRVLRIGAPMAAGTALYAGVYWAMLKTSISPLGPHVNAALGIGFSALESFSWPVFHGVSLGVASLVGRHLGASRPDLAQLTLRRAVPLSTACGIVASLIFYFFGEPLTALFTDDPRVHASATEYAVILAASQLFVSWEALAEGVLAGAGDTRTVFWMNAPLNLLRIPLAWLLAFPFELGAAGIWWSINLTCYAKALLKGWAAYRGRWTLLDP